MSNSDHQWELAPLPTAPVRRLAFLGTPDIAAEVLSSLIARGYDIAVVVTRPDTRRGRGSAVSPSPVKELALRHGIRVEHDVERLVDVHREQGIELGVVVAYGAIVPVHILASIPMVNVHVSLLPRWRGAAPIERAILAGDDRTGVCLMQLEKGLDTGGVISSAAMSIDGTTTVTDIRRGLISDGIRLLIDALDSGRFAVSPQSGEPTYAAKILPEERRVRWDESASMASRRVRIGEAWTIFRGKRLKLHEVEVVDTAVPMGTIRLDAEDVLIGCAQGSIRLVVVQPDGRPRLAVTEWARGARLIDGEAMDPSES